MKSDLSFSGAAISGNLKNIYYLSLLTLVIASGVMFLCHLR